MYCLVFKQVKLPTTSYADRFTNLHVGFRSLEYHSERQCNGIHATHTLVQPIVFMSVWPIKHRTRTYHQIVVIPAFQKSYAMHEYYEPYMYIIHLS